MNVIKYKQYRFDELGKTFFDSPVFFSRSSNFRAGCPGRPDMVKALLENERSAGSTVYSVVIKAELQNHVDYVSESLTELGYTLCYDRFPVWMKTFRVSCKQNSGSLMLLKNTLAVMDGLVKELPMCLYATTQTRRLRAYVDFLTTREMIIPFSAICHGNKKTATPKWGRSAAQSRYVRQGFGRMEDAYRIAELPNREWCAWIDGDEYIPLFPDERLAVRFLENRHLLFATG